MQPLSYDSWTEVECTEHCERGKKTHRLKAALVAKTEKLIVGDGKMIYTKEALEAARLKVVANPDALEAEYIRGWNDAIEAVINNFGSVSDERPEDKG